MSSRQKPYDRRDAPSQGGLKTILGLFRTPKATQKDPIENKRKSFVPPQDIPSAQGARFQGGQSQSAGQSAGQSRRPREHGKDGGAPRKLAPSKGSSAGRTNEPETATPSFFTRLLGRKQPQEQSRAAGDGARAQRRDQALQAVGGTGGRTARPRRENRHSVVAPDLDQRGSSRIDARINTARDDKRRSQIYVPTHASTDFTRLPMAHSLKDRYSTLMAEEEAKRLSQMLAQLQLSPPPEPDDSRPQSYVSDDMFRDDQRRRTFATLEGNSNVDSNSSFGVDVGLNNTLQPPPTPTRRQHKRHSYSYALAQDPQQISEEPEEPSVYQKEPSEYQVFLQQALIKDRRESQQMRHATMGQSDKRRSLNAVHPDSMNIQDLLSNSCTLERSNTFGGSRKKDKSGSRHGNNDTARKRASHYSTHLRDDRNRHSYIGGDLGADLGAEPAPRDARKRSSMTNRLSDYFKPPREVNNKYEQPENKRLSRASFR